jgi:hypothetical protein
MNGENFEVEKIPKFIIFFQNLHFLSHVSLLCTNLLHSDSPIRAKFVQESEQKNIVNDCSRVEFR